MRKSRRRALFAGVLLVAAVSLTSIFFTPQKEEPVYLGIKLSDWLNGYPPPPANRTRTGWPAPIDEAIRQMGTNSLPLLLEQLRAWDSDSMWKQNLLRFARWQKVVKFSRTPSEVLNDHAMLGFTALGPSASNAVPEVLQILKGRETSYSGFCCIEVIGAIGPGARSAIPSLEGLYTTTTNVSLRHNLEITLRKIDPAAADRIVAEAKGTNAPR